MEMITRMPMIPMMIWYVRIVRCWLVDILLFFGMIQLLNRYSR